MEGQFALTFDRATQEKGVSGELLLQKLERRLDNVVYRLGFGSSRDQARQLVRHGHVTVNGKRVTIPSQELHKGDVVEIKSKSRQMIVLRHNLDTLDRAVPAWLDVTSADFKATVRDLPLREQIDVPVREQLIVELYSK
jgi:small subunit ribosomal protein S4